MTITQKSLRNAHDFLVDAHKTLDGENISTIQATCEIATGTRMVGLALLELLALAVEIQVDLPAADRPGAGVDESPRPGPLAAGETVVTVCLPDIPSGISDPNSARVRRNLTVKHLIEAVIASGGSFHVQAPR